MGGGGGGENGVVEEVFGYVIGGADEGVPGFADGSESEKRLWRQPGEDFQNHILREKGGWFVGFNCREKLVILTQSHFQGLVEARFG
jgi:hypothetical protein